MRKIIYIFSILFLTCSCSNKESSCNTISKEQLMESWAWKIFIFTDEGEIQPIRNNFDTIINSKLTYEDDNWDYSEY